MFYSLINPFIFRLNHQVIFAMNHFNHIMKAFITFLFVASVTLLPAETISVEDFGVKPHSFKDAVEGVKQAIEACKKHPDAKLVFPEGRYDFWPDKAEKREYYVSNTTTETECPSKIKHIGLLFENMKNLTVEGNGSLFVFHGKMVTWALDHCENIRLQNFTVDFERPTMSEITFREVTPNVIVGDVHPDSRYAIMDNKLLWYGDQWLANENNYFSILTDIVAGTELYSSFSPLNESKVTELKPFQLKFEGNFRDINYQAGKTLTIRDHIRDHVGAFINLSKNIQLDHITMHYMHGLGIVSQFSENLTYTAINITPSRKRTIAGFADGMHFSGCKGHIKVENCNFKGLHDDPMNIHGTFLQIKEIQSPTRLIVRFMHGQTYGFPAFFENDTVAFIYSKAVQTKGKAIVKKVVLLSEREIEIELSHPVPSGIHTGDCLENLTWTPSLEVRNCRFEMTNTRGLLITTPKKVVVENNYFYRTGMYAIQIACDAGSWYESGEVRDVLIQNNIFEECGYNRVSGDSYTIAINPENHEVVKKHWVHRNVRINGNTFKVFDDLVLKAKSTDSLLFENNIVEHSNWVTPLEKSDNKESNFPAFQLENCTNVILKNNTIEIQKPVVINCMQMKKSDLKAGKGFQTEIK